MGIKYVINYLTARIRKQVDLITNLQTIVTLLENEQINQAHQMAERITNDDFRNELPYDFWTLKETRSGLMRKRSPSASSYWVDLSPDDRFSFLKGIEELSHHSKRQLKHWANLPWTRLPMRIKSEIINFLHNEWDIISNFN